LPADALRILSGARRNDAVVGTGTYPLPSAPDLTRREPGRIGA
jgi:hypothetical protein